MPPLVQANTVAMKLPSVAAVCRRLDALIKLWRDRQPQPAELYKIATELDAPEDGTQKEWTRLIRCVPWQ